MAQFEVLAYWSAAEVQIAVAHADVVAAVAFIFDSERRYLAGVKNI